MNEDKQRRYIASIARAGARIKPLGRMCSTCAFKLDSIANKSPITVDGAMDALSWDLKFHCHTEDGKDKGCLCTGFKYAKQYFEQLENKL